MEPITILKKTTNLPAFLSDYDGIRHNICSFFNYMGGHITIFPLPCHNSIAHFKVLPPINIRFLPSQNWSKIVTDHAPITIFHHNSKVVLL